MSASESISFWVVMAACGLATYLIRLTPILLVGSRGFPPWIARALRFVPPAVLTAIILPEVLISGGRIALDLSNARLPAALAAALIAWKTRNTILTILVGMLVLWILRFATGVL